MKRQDPTTLTCNLMHVHCSVIMAEELKTGCKSVSILCISDYPSATG